MDTSYLKQNGRPVKICYVLAYDQPRYVRTEVLLAMLHRIEGEHIYKAINTNTHRGFARYLQTLGKLVVIRFRYRPDVYLLGFRGYEIYWPVRLLTLGKPLVFDEFINPYLWFVEEHRKFAPGSVAAKALRLYARSMLRSTEHILSDTNLHAAYSSRVLDIPLSKFTALYVGTNEQLFQATATQNAGRPKTPLKVFFYGNFLPLHGLSVILAAAEQLKNEPIEFTIVGGAKRQADMAKFVAELETKQLTNVRHLPWVPYNELPGYIAASDMCLGGPFGDTPQGRLVISGKTYQFLAMGKAVVVGRIDEDTGFADKQNCLLIAQGSSRALAEALLWAQHHRQQLPVIGKNGRALYEQRFSVRAQKSRLQTLIESLSTK